MDKRKNRTWMAKKKDLKHEWLLIDAKGKTLGRLAAEIAKILRGKHRPTFTPHMDTGGGVVIINADKIHVTGAKEAQKNYYRYTGYPGGQRVTSFRAMMDRKPTYILEHAVRGMMPRTRLGRAQLRRLRIYAGAEHDMQAQQPVPVNC